MTQENTTKTISHEERKKNLDEVQKLLYPYNLNRVIRYGKKRIEEFETQSVAEHVANMIFLAHYFKDLEDKENKMDFAKIIRMILIHDMPEIENGDIISVRKTKEDSDKDLATVGIVAKKSPKFIAEEIESLYTELEDQKTPEAQFVNCIDKFDGQLFWFHDKGIEMIRDLFVKNGLEMNSALIMYNKILTNINSGGFTEMAKFFEVIHDQKEKMGLYNLL